MIKNNVKIFMKNASDDSVEANDDDVDDVGDDTNAMMFLKEEERKCNVMGMKTSRHLHQAPSSTRRRR